MSLIAITPDLLETFSLVLHPSRSFTSSSDGITGSVGLVARPSPSVKDVLFFPESSAGSAFSVADYGKDAALQNMINQYREDKRTGTTRDYTGYFENSSGTGYLDLLSATTQSIKNTVEKIVRRFVPPKSFTVLTDPGNTFDQALESEDRLVKETILGTLYPAYSYKPGNYSFDYTNYNALNFFTASSVSESAALIYPGSTGSCVVSSSFSLNFFINPRYTTETTGSAFTAGTLFHVSSSIAVSLSTGSSVDPSGFPDSYRIILQLSSSAEVSPSRVNLSTANNSRTGNQHLVFVSEDFKIKRDHWSFVSIRWGGNYNAGTGSISIDGSKTYFVVPSSSISTKSSIGQVFLGGFYNGSNRTDFFFNGNVAIAEGLDSLAGSADPSNASITNQLNGEIHDIKFYNRYLSDAEILAESAGDDVNSSGLKFYVQPFFLTGFNGTPFRRGYPVDLAGGTRNFYSTTPFNKHISGNSRGRLINLTNFVMNLADKTFPRLYGLTGSFGYSVQPREDANGYIQRSKQANRSNLSIVPCDDGNYNPHYGQFVTSSAWGTDRFGNPDPTIINLRNIFLGVNSALGVPGSTTTKDTFGVVDLSDTSVSHASTLTEADVATLTTVKPDIGYFNLGLTTSTTDIKYMPSLTRDLSSDEVVIFEISNLFYGERILPGSVTIRDTSVTGSNGMMKMTVKDDGLGNLYRADSFTKNATWASVGNVFYDEGFIIIKSPHLHMFGQDAFEIDFKGETSSHVLTVNLPLAQGLINSSSNPAYLPVSSSLDFNDTDPQFVYITGVQIHDENLNVVMRANLAQPLKKRNSDEYLIKLKVDF